MYATSLAGSYLADRFLKRNILSTTAVRKIFGTIAFLVPCFFMLVLALWGDIASVALISFCITLSVHAFIAAGHCANILDISPNFSGTICGIVNTVSAFTVYFSTKLVATLVRNDHSFKSWQPLFWIWFTGYGIGGVMFFILCSGKIQSWDLVVLMDPELEPLKGRSN